MKITVDNGRMLGEIRKEFNVLYPFLRIDFFREGETNGIVKKEKLADDFQLIEKNPVPIDIGEKRSITDVKKDFFEHFGLVARVYRRSGNVWVETSHTDHWSLKQQNFEGEQMNE